MPEKSQQVGGRGRVGSQTHPLPRAVFLAAWLGRSCPWTPSEEAVPRGSRLWAMPLSSPGSQMRLSVCSEPDTVLCQDGRVMGWRNDSCRIWFDVSAGPLTDSPVLSALLQWYASCLVEASSSCGVGCCGEPEPQSGLPGGHGKWCSSQGQPDFHSLTHSLKSVLCLYQLFCGAQRYSEGTQLLWSGASIPVG